MNALASMKSNGALDCIRQSIASRPSKVILLLSTDEAAPEILCPGLPPQHKRNADMPEWVQCRATIKGLYLRRGWKSWDCSTWRTGGSRGILAMCINIWREEAERTERSSCQWYKSKSQWGQTGTQKALSKHQEAPLHWSGDTSGEIESPSLGMFESCLNVVLGSWL